MSEIAEYYSKEWENLILRDFLAMDRTKLANERTFLSYVRTFIGMLGGGIALIKFVEEPPFVHLGVALEILSPFVLVFGMYRFISLSIKIKRVHAMLKTTERAEPKKK